MCPFVGVREIFPHYRPTHGENQCRSDIERSALRIADTERHRTIGSASDQSAAEVVDSSVSPRSDFTLE